MNKYFAFIEREAQLDREFEEEIKTRLPGLAAEAAQFFREKNHLELDNYRCLRLARLLEALVVKLNKNE